MENSVGVSREILGRGKQAETYELTSVCNVFLDYALISAKVIIMVTRSY